MIDISTKKVAFGGLMTALSVVILYVASLLPTLKLAVCFVSSVVICVVMIKYGVRAALIVYLATSTVVLIISPDKVIGFGYILFFGNYPIIKAFTEHVKKLSVEWTLKIILFALYVFIAFVGMEWFFFGNIVLPYGKTIVFTGAVVAACIYDFALSMVIAEFNRRFSKFI